MSDIENTSREVIENSLLVALSDDDKVAIVCTKDELELLVYALDLAIVATPSRNEYDRMTEYRADILKLKSVLD